MKNKMLNLVGAGLLVASCTQEGDNYHNYPDGNGSGEMSSNCGNSPLRGKNLWEISRCKYGISFGEDCTAEVSGSSDCEYNGLEVTCSNGRMKFDPNARFTAGSNFQKVNQKLDQYGGYVDVNFCKTLNFIDDCAFVPVSRRFPGINECRSSKYFAGE